jgi:uncharacterized phage protein (TIGR01671 family)
MEKMREIKFRGYQEALDYFVYGDYCQVPNIEEGQVYKHWIVREDGFKYFIKDEKSIGQYAGLKDKNGKEIYEGDVLGKESHWSFYIGFRDGCFVMIPCEKVQRLNWTWHPVGQNMIEGWEITGNIYENPELLTA